MEYIKKMDPDIALRWIADAGCSKWAHGHDAVAPCIQLESTRGIDAQFGSDTVCTSCLANAVLYGIPVPLTVGAHADGDTYCRCSGAGRYTLEQNRVREPLVVSPRCAVHSPLTAPYPIFGLTA